MASPIFTSLMALVSLFKTTSPPKKNSTSPTPKWRKYRTTSLPTPVTLNKISGIVRTPTFRRKVRLYCKTGFHLVMLPGGTLKGSFSANVTKTYGIFELQSYGRSLIRVKNVAHQKYIAIGNTGQVYSTVNATMESLLRDTYKENRFHSFSSYLYQGKNQGKSWYLAINQHGHVKNAARVLMHHRSYQFQIIERKTKTTNTGNSMHNVYITRHMKGKGPV